LSGYGLGTDSNIGASRAVGRVDLELPPTDDDTEIVTNPMTGERYKCGNYIYDRFLMLRGGTAGDFCVDENDDPMDGVIVQYVDRSVRWYNCGKEVTPEEYDTPDIPGLGDYDGIENDHWYEAMFVDWYRQRPDERPDTWSGGELSQKQNIRIYNYSYARLFCVTNDVRATINTWQRGVDPWGDFPGTRDKPWFWDGWDESLWPAAPGARELGEKLALRSRDCCSPARTDTEIEQHYTWHTSPD
jgi:hypothetical protein